MEKIIISLLESKDHANYILAYYLVKGIKDKWKGTRKVSRKDTYTWKVKYDIQGIYIPEKDWFLVWGGKTFLYTQPCGHIHKRHNYE